MASPWGMQGLGMAWGVQGMRSPRVGLSRAEQPVRAASQRATPEAADTPLKAGFGVNRAGLKRAGVGRCEQDRREHLSGVKRPTCPV